MRLSEECVLRRAISNEPRELLEWYGLEAVELREPANRRLREREDVVEA